MSQRDVNRKDSSNEADEELVNCVTDGDPKSYREAIKSAKSEE